MIPSIRPKEAPTAIEGTKIPAGILQPYETTTRPIRMTVARSNELAMRHCSELLIKNALRQSDFGSYCSAYWHSPA
jgi:hypothetical protein